jgi:hypothetical protein
MEHLNPELLFQRMSRGALRGPAEEEIRPMARCKGELENGTRCEIVAAPGRELCTRCEKRGAKLYVAPLRTHDLGKKKGRPAKKGQASEAEQELQEIVSLCPSCAGEASCGNMRVTECAAFSPQEKPVSRLTDAAQANRDEFEAEYGGGDCSCHISPPCNSCLHPGNPANQDDNDNCWTTEPVREADKLEPWARDEERTQAMLLLVGIDVSIGVLQSVTVDQIRAAEAYAAALHLQASDNDDVEIPPMPFFLKGLQKSALATCAESQTDHSVEANEAVCINSECEFFNETFDQNCAGERDGEPAIASCKNLCTELFTDAQISPQTAEDPLEAATPCAELSSPLAAVLVELPAPSPPLPDTSVVIDFPPEMFDALTSKGVGTATILELLHVLFISKEYGLVRHEAA